MRGSASPARDEMALDANEEINFDRSVRVLVDTDVDTHFVVWISRTSSVTELRELVKSTHRLCFPGKGDVDIGSLAVPGGEYGYRLADFLRVGQVYDNYQGKVLAEVKTRGPASNNNRDYELFRKPTFSFTNSSTPKKVPLLAPPPFENVGESGAALLAVEANLLELKEPKLQKEELDGDANCLLASQEPPDELPNKVSELAVLPLQESVEEEDEKVVERPGLDVHMEPDKITEGATPALTFDIKGVSRKRNASLSIERPSKSRRLTEPAPSGSTLNLPEENSQPEVRNGAIERAQVDRLLNTVKDMNEPTLMNRSGDLDSNLLLSSGGIKRRKKKHVRNLALTISQNRSEAVKDKEEMFDAKNGKKEDTGLVVGSGVQGSGIVVIGLEIGSEEISGSLPDGSGLSPAAYLEKKKKRKKKKQKKQKQKQELNQELIQEQNHEQEQERKLKKEQKRVQKQEQNQELNQEQEQEQEQERKLQKEQKQERKPKSEKKKKKQKKFEVTPVASASLNHVPEESDREHEQEDGQCTEAVVDLGHHQLGATATSPDHSQHKNNNGEVDSNNDNQGVEKKSTGKKLKKKKGSTPAKGSQDSRTLSVLNPLKDEVSESRTQRSEAQSLKATSGDGGMIPNGGTELADIDDKVLAPKMNLLSNFDDVETSTSHKGATQAAKVGSVESQETSNSSKRAGRGAPSETHNSGSSEDVSKGEGIQQGRDNTKASEIQSFQGSEKAEQHSEGISKGSVKVSAAQRSTSYSEATSERVIASPGNKVSHDVSGIERLESELPGHIDKVAHSRTCTGESSAESDPRSADQAEARSQQDVISRKEDQVLKMNPTPSSLRSLEKHASTSPKGAEGGEVNTKNDSLQFFSQDQSFQVAPTQVAKALSGNTTEDSSDESDTSPDEGIDELKKQKADSKLGISNKGGQGESEESSDESGDLATTGRRDNPPLTTTSTPVPLVSGMPGSGGITSSQIFKRRASGVTAEIEAKFAHFIESQDGLDELMGITLGQRKRSMPIEPSTQAGSLATAPDSSPLDVALNTQESVKSSPMMTLPGSVMGLERYQAIDIAPASQNSTGKLLPAPQFKVPKPVPIGKTLPGVQSSGKEAPKTAVKELRLKRKDSTIKPADSKMKESNSLLQEKHNDASPLPVRETSKETLMDAAEGKEKSSGIHNLLSTPETLKETLRDDVNAAVDRKFSVEETSKERKKLEEQNQDSQFMIVNNTDHILEHEREENQLEPSDDETKGPPCINEDAPNMTGKKRKERIVGSPETSGFDTSGQKKKRKKSESEGSNKKKKRKSDGTTEVDNILPETSVDRSARETEELYLKLEKAKKDLWLQTNSVSSFKKDEEKVENNGEGYPPAVNSTGIEAADVAQSRLEAGEAGEIDDPTEESNDKVKVVSDIPGHGGNATADSHESRDDMCAGTTEASDREDGGFLSQDGKAGPPSHQEKSQMDVFDFVSEDEAPMKTPVAKPSAKKTPVSKPKSGTKENNKAKLLDDVASRAVERVLDDEMLHVMDSNSALGKKPRKDAKPVKWTVRMRGSPSVLVPSLHGGTVPSDATHPTQLISNPPHVASKSAGDVSGRGAQVQRGLEGTPKATPKPTKARALPKAPPKSKQSGAVMCPVGCGRAYSGRTSAYYSHKKNCTGAPVE